MKWQCLTLAVAASLIFLSCDEPGAGGRACTTEARAGITVRIRDAAKGTPASRGAMVVAYDRAFVDTLRGFPEFDSLTVSGVYERPGVYRVVVQKTGYREWVRENVVVHADECHVVTVILDAHLERQP